ncbi:hypothetical protein QUF72_03005 [Desulfobacterales bacterium HSG2]|nr:hypothetical protein [Desulfobacterales bacterium HSG2]
MKAFVRRFLKGMGWNTREMRVGKSPSKEGSAEQWVRENFPPDWQIRRRAWICQSKPSEAAQTKIMANPANATADMFTCSV